MQIEIEFDKLIEAGFIREVKYLTWIENIVPIKKKNGHIRGCVDFRDLNNVCPKDDFSLPIIELISNTLFQTYSLFFLRCLLKEEDDDFKEKDLEIRDLNEMVGCCHNIHFP